MIAPNNDSENKMPPKKTPPLRSAKTPVPKFTEEDLQELLESVLADEDLQEEVL
jgi:hypothetical protein